MGSRQPSRCTRTRHDKGTSQSTLSHKIVNCYTRICGGFNDSDYSMLLDANCRTLWVSGCDRWQQLGLGSSHGGAFGYTWEQQGRIWRNAFVKNNHVWDRMQQDDADCKIRDLALGEGNIRLSCRRINMMCTPLGGAVKVN